MSFLLLAEILIFNKHKISYDSLDAFAVYGYDNLLK
jgi:hydroxyacyl-ACP dehydratase HTD2-like protein with hotdog domain